MYNCIKENLQEDVMKVLLTLTIQDQQLRVKKTCCYVAPVNMNLIAREGTMGSTLAFVGNLASPPNN